MTGVRPVPPGLLLHLSRFLILGAVTQAAFGATVVVNNLDAGTGLGFDDPTSVSPVAGNSGTTLGEQRLNAFEAAAAKWAAILVSPVTIQVNATMTALTPCGPTGGVLGSAGAQSAHRDFPNAPLANTWYPQALANSLAGSDLSPNPDIAANFNRSVDDDPNCISGVTWSYVIDAPAPNNTIAFTNTVLHEIGHGIGVAGFTNVTTGQFLASYPDHYGSFLYSETFDQPWIELTDAERVTVATDTGNLTWDGPEVGNVDDFLSAGVQASGRTRLYAPAGLAPGSSVNHFDTALTPNELMEPFDTDDNEQLLTNHLLLDVGWREQLAVPSSLTDGLSAIYGGDAIAYTLTVQNDGPGDIRLVDGSVSADLPHLIDISWTCSGSGGGSCAEGSGTGPPTDQLVTLPLGAGVSFQVDAIVDPLFSGTLNVSATFTPPDNLVNTAPSSADDATDVTPVGITVSPTSGLETTEGGGADSFSVVLDAQPGDDVSIAISSSDESEGTVSPTSLTFTPDDWDTPQVVTVTGQDDGDPDGAVAYQIVTAPAASTDGVFDGRNAADVDALNLDDDPGIIVSAISGATVETGATASFTVAAATPPASAVTVGLSSSDPGEGTVPTEVVLPAGVTTPQMVTVTGVDDALDDSDVGYTIVTAASSSDDPAYAGIDPDDVAVVNVDDDFLVGGTVSGPVGDGLVLRNNGGDDLSVTGAGPFAFATPVSDGGGYQVTLYAPPADTTLKCTVQNGSGTIQGSDVSSVSVTCVQTCNLVIVEGVTVNSTVDHEACETLELGPDYTAETGADLFLSSGESIRLLPGFRLDKGATLDAASCGQSLCATSPNPMPYGCHSCVVQICDQDAWCCNNDFDEICLGQVESVCGLICQ